MSWAKLDDSMPDDGAITILSDAAFRAYVTAICFSARMLTNGHLPIRKANEFAGRKAKAVVSELVPERWHGEGYVCSSPKCKETAARGEYVIHNYLRYNPTRAYVLAERAKAKSRMFGLRSPEQEPEHQENFDGSSDAPVIPVSPSLPVVPESPPPQARAPVPTRVVAVAFEQGFGRLLSPTELELIKALEEEHPKERIEYALREAAALNKRSVRYVQRTCERMANDGDNDGTASSRKPGQTATPNGVAAGVRGVEQHEPDLMEQRRHRTV